MKRTDNKDASMGRLLGETIKFIEICQSLVFIKNISEKDYFSFTGVKFSFIQNFITAEGYSFEYGSEEADRLVRIIRNDFVIRLAFLLCHNKQ